MPERARRPRRPTALLRVTFWDGEGFEWSPLLTTINHIIIGKLTINHTGGAWVRAALASPRQLAAALRLGAHCAGHLRAGTLHVRSRAGGLASKTIFREPVMALGSKHKHAVRSSARHTRRCGAADRAAHAALHARRRSRGTVSAAASRCLSR